MQRVHYSQRYHLEAVIMRIVATAISFAAQVSRLI